MYKTVLMCICVYKFLNKNVIFYDTKLVKIRIQELKVTNVNNLDKIKREFYFLTLFHL